METYNSKHLTDGDIKKIINQYNKKRERETKQYHEIKKLDDVFMKDNNERAKKYYQDNKDKVKLRYKENQNPTQIKCLFRYYKNLNRVGEFKIKHNEKYNYLVGEGIIVKEDNLNNIADLMK
tara:strand:- start:224 stop:589 length:366 start_codon:yes stop_codon:yes gene_type:complete